MLTVAFPCPEVQRLLGMASCLCLEGCKSGWGGGGAGGGIWTNSIKSRSRSTVI